MGLGVPKMDNRPEKDWNYPPPNTPDGYIKAIVCAQVKLNDKGKKEILRILEEDNR